MDIDGDTVYYTYEWSKDGVPFGLTTRTTALSVTISSMYTAPGENWFCVVTPDDPKLPLCY